MREVRCPPTATCALECNRAWLRVLSHGHARASICTGLEPPGCPGDLTAKPTRNSSSAASPTREGPAPGSGRYCWAITTPITLVYAGKVGTASADTPLDRLHVMLAGLAQGPALFRPRLSAAVRRALGPATPGRPGGLLASGPPTGSCATRGSRAFETTGTPPSSGRRAGASARVSLPPALRFTMTVTNTLSSGSASFSRVAPATASGESPEGPCAGARPRSAAA
jgi:hypothetical protein